MLNQYKDWQYWILQNLQLLYKIYGQDNVVLTGDNWQSMSIRHFVLPDNWGQETTRLLIILPAKSKIFYTPPDRFYLEKGLRTITGETPRHYFESKGFNDMSKQNLDRFSFHLKRGWDPKINCQDGTNLLHIIDGLYKGLDLGAREAMNESDYG